MADKAADSTPSATEDDRAGRIVLAAYELLDSAGLEGLTIRAVLARTGLARRAFYDCFAGKDALVLAVFAYTLRLAAGYFAEAVIRLPDPLARVEAIVTGIVMGSAAIEGAHDSGSNRRSAALSREHLRLAEAHPPELQAAVAPLIDLIAAHLADGMAAGQVRAGDPARMAALVYNLVSTTVHTQLIAEEAATPDRARREALAEEIREFCRRAVAA
ncbi:TetR/AcrR family transcriptional regulator [Novosphingobium sp.]|uniref:TetR/AcrR family transcriptional regulator n=1 Tax=Novosphingobium sp. TaxID=1874826 RepID=UPI0025F8BBE0|nr:TetR/AcrR family transcriptional regulator [Novosphingobium sp.]